MAYTTTTAKWTGTGGGTGYTRWHWQGNLTSAEVTQKLNLTKTFFTAIATLIPTPVAVGFDGLAQEYDDAGVLTKEVSVTPPTSVVGSAGPNFLSVIGAVVNWQTGVFNPNGRRIRGRTYLVPLGTSIAATNGGLTSSAVSTIASAANAVIADLIPFVVVRKTATGDFVGITGITAAQVSGKVAILTSRRD